LLEEACTSSRYVPRAYGDGEAIEALEVVDGLLKLVEEVEVYVFGSAVESRLTVDSVIDVVLVVEEVPGSRLERMGLLDRLWRLVESRGVPWWYPFDVYLLTRGSSHC